MTTSLVSFSNSYYKKFHGNSFPINSGLTWLKIGIFVLFSIFTYLASTQPQGEPKGVAFAGAIISELVFLSLFGVRHSSENKRIISQYNTTHNTQHLHLLDCRLDYLEKTLASKGSEEISAICNDYQDLVSIKTNKNKSEMMLWAIFPFEHKDRFITLLTCLIAIIAAALIVGGQSLETFFEFYGNLSNFLYGQALLLTLTAPLFLIGLYSYEIIGFLFGHFSTMRDKDNSQTIHLIAVNFLLNDLRLYQATVVKRI